jgi:hypothetical protein
MASLSLQEAADQAGTSKVDVWRAIREGRLSARKTDDGGFAIDRAELFRVFETRPPEQSPAEPNAAPAPQALESGESGATTEMVAPEDMTAAFAALGAELKSLLGLPAESATNDERPNDNADGQAADLAERNARLAAELAAERAKSEKAVAEYAALADRLAELAAERERRPWWRRLVD